MAYCMYLRKSRADMELEALGEMETLKRHEQILLDVSKKQKLIITKIYKEIVSGETIASRPVVQQLLDEVEREMWEGVLVMEIERLARGDTIDQGIVARAFKDSNTKIITPTKTFDPRNEFDEEYFEFGLFMSRREYKTINRRIQRGRRTSAQEGKFIGSTPPYGYDKVKIEGDKGYTLKPNKEAEVVKLIFKLYIDGMGSQAIAQRLDELSIPPRNSTRWSRATIKDIIKNPVYMGKIRWGYKSEKKLIENGTQRKIRKKSDNYIYVDGIHEPIISESDFTKAQEQRKNATHKKIKNDCSLKNPLSGLIKCKICGSNMTRLKGKRATSFDAIICPNRHCANVSASMALIEQEIIKILKVWIKSEKVSINISSKRVPDNKRLIKTLKSNIATLDTQIEKAYELLEQGIYTAEIFVKRQTALNDKKSALLAQLSALDQQEYERKKYENYLPRVKKVIAIYNEAEDVATKNKLLKSIISYVEYRKDKPNTKYNGNNANFELHIYPKL